eukprot:gene5443-973_t
MSAPGMSASMAMHIVDIQLYVYRQRKPLVVLEEVYHPVFDKPVVKALRKLDVYPKRMRSTGFEHLVFLPMRTGDSLTTMAVAVSLQALAFDANAQSDAGDGRQWVVLDGPQESAACLDGSPYSFWLWPGNSSEWTIFFNGGGWCLTEELCQARTLTGLGSSRGYNQSGGWGPTPANIDPQIPTFTCQGTRLPSTAAAPGVQQHHPGGTCAHGSTAHARPRPCLGAKCSVDPALLTGLDPNCTKVYLPYCDGSCFTSHRAGPWPVPNSSASLTFRGLDNLDRTLDTLEDRYGFHRAERLPVTGGSAGGLSPFLHVDHIQARLAAARARAAPQVKQTVGGLHPSSKGTGPVVVGRPVAGFFIDSKPFSPSQPDMSCIFQFPLSLNRHLLPSQPSYADTIKYGVAMFNATHPLSPGCKAAYPDQQWRCWMAPFASPYVQQPLFVVQSRFDEFQLQALLGLPCFHGQAYKPPFKPANCTPAEKTAITAFGAELLQQMQPLLATKASTGTWLVSCIQHDVVCDLHGLAEEEAFSSWLAGEPLGQDKHYRWVDDCGED